MFSFSVKTRTEQTIFCVTGDVCSLTSAYRVENLIRKGKKKKSVKDVVTQDEFEVSVFLTEIGTRHFLLAKSKTFKDKAAASKWLAEKSSEIESAVSTYLTHVTADPKYASVTKVLAANLATATDVPAVVTNSFQTTTYTTIPNWYTRLPDDVRQYYESVGAAEMSIAMSIVSAAAPPGITPGPMVRMGVYGAAGVAALGAAGGMLL